MARRRHTPGQKLDSLDAASMRAVLPRLKEKDQQLMVTGGETDEERARAEALVVERRDLLNTKKRQNTRDAVTDEIDDEAEAALAVFGCDPI